MIGKGGGKGRRKVQEERVLVMKFNENENLPYYGEYLSVKSG